MKTRKRLTVCAVFHKKNSVARLFFKRNDDVVISVNDRVKVEKLGLFN